MIKNKNIGIKTAYWEATGKRPKTLREALVYFGLKTVKLQRSKQ